MGVTVLVGLLVFAATAVVYWVWDRRQRQSLFEKLGIPGPKPSLLFGNFGELRKKGFHVCLKEWRQKYGRTYGYYEAHRPILVTSDVDLIQQITIKQFSKFHGRKSLDFRNDKFINMFTTEGPRWKKLRSIGSQMFMARRMKEMTPLIKTVMDKVMSLFEEKARTGEVFDILDIFQCMTLEVIKNCGFGIGSDALFEPSDAFLTHCREFFGRLEDEPPLAFKIMGTISALLPGSMTFVAPIMIPLMGTIEDWFHDTAKVMILDRMKNKGARKDFIELMLDVRQADEIKESDLIAHADDDTFSPRAERAEAGAGNEASKHSKDPKSEAGKLSMEEMQAQCMMLLITGYETSSTGLGFLSYDLAMNPEVQERLRNEIDEHFPQENVHPDYQSVQNLPYMDFVMKECLRLHTIAAVAMTRCTMEDTTLECADFPDGLKLPVGLEIQLNAEDLHLDPEHWGPEDPMAFVPERFDPERVKNRHKMAWMPFGQGPRNCVGMRFGLMEIKMILVRLLKAYRIEKTDKTPESLEVKKNNVQGPKDGVFVRLVKRNL